MFIIGLDLGQANDYTAIAIIEKIEQDGGATYHVRNLERTKGTPYPEIVRRVQAIMKKLPSETALVVDQTGVGAPVVDMFTGAKLNPNAILIHGGDRVTHEGNTWRVPKRDLVAVLQVLLQNQRLKIALRTLSDTLAKELLNFKVKIDPLTAHDSYSAWREQDHDDLVLAVALAGWYGEGKGSHMVLDFRNIVPVRRYPEYSDFSSTGYNGGSWAEYAYKFAHRNRR